MELPSPYEILGIEKTDDPVEIKQAYRQMALKYHPDKNPNAGNKEINKAYQILSNEDSKLFFDSFGYEGLILNEKLNSRGENNLMGMGHIDFILIFASIFTLYFIYLTKRSPDLSFCLFILISNLVLYFILPTRILPTVTNFVIYGIVLLWPNITKKNSSLTVTIWISIIIIDIWRGIRFEHWIWRFLSLNIIIFGSIILMLMGIYVLKKPETGIIKSLDVMTLVFVVFWCPVWILDYFTGRRIEWLIPPAIFFIKNTDEEPASTPTATESVHNNSNNNNTNNNSNSSSGSEKKNKKSNSTTTTNRVDDHHKNNSPLKANVYNSKEGEESNTAASGESQTAVNSSPSTKKQSSSALDKRCQTCFKSANLKKCGRCQQNNHY
ncbi:hypothetical protein PPL_07092 [Heterostelium album PN500]|uniref:J domain-containing protein n=1 Tax=Heterostelium pallidum (strain ATCC 26659 / Pp 5 / PN500) TaxID=670386 RepID=D3BED5_HETP5|nr:hypothetical protein PPL_07092 [Heterostelium album PN500]EFA80266.1 hypothetical protein PPL_07092 [Heterostelium album PN500]|eukprot:XP_020432386.1 hypothetical protein PPL_07092 [Heterostelium album PN500]